MIGQNKIEDRIRDAATYELALNRIMGQYRSIGFDELSTLEETVLRLTLNALGQELVVTNGEIGFKQKVDSKFLD